MILLLTKEISYFIDIVKLKIFIQNYQFSIYQGKKPLPLTYLMKIIYFGRNIYIKINDIRKI